MGTVVAPAERTGLGAASDHELVAAVRRGEDRAFERLYERYHRRIAAYVYGMVNDYGRAEDITQEVFISALRRMRETERPIAFKPWIYEIAKNACIDQFRRSRRAEEVSYDAEDGVGALESARLASVDAGPDAAIDAKQQLDHLCGAFGGLSETHHQILVLRELEGLSYREIGEKMGLSRPSVESTLFRARRRLTEEYDELVSGERCSRIQTIILATGQGAPGARDQRRLVRHIAHCQPCRREARLAGLQVGSLSRHPVRDAVAAKVAAFLPFPWLFRSKRSSEAAQQEAAAPNFVAQLSGPLVHAAEPLTGWTKAAAAAATVLVAGAGAAGVAQLTASDKGSDPKPVSAVTGDAGSSAKKATRPAAVDRGATTGRRNASTGGTRTSDTGPAVSRRTAAGEAKAPVATDAPERATLPSAPPAPPRTPVVPTESERDPSPTVPSVRLPTSAGQAIGEAKGTADTVDPRVGGTLEQLPPLPGE